MANIFKSFFDRFVKKNQPNNKTIEVIEVKTTDKISSFGYNVNDTVTQDYQTESLLTELRNATSSGDKIELIAAKDPDVSMAVWAFQRLCMQGVNIEITDLNGNRLDEAEALFNQQCKHWNRIGNDGLDGIIDNLHKTGLLYNIMMIEVVVDNSNNNTFSGIYIIDPRTLEWQLEERDGVEQWIPYQDQDGDKVDLTTGNIFWVVSNPDITTPTGPYLLEPAIPAVDYKLQTIRDSSAVLRRQGYPYNVYTIDKERVINSLPASMRNNKKEISNAVREAVNLAKEVAANREPTQDIVVTNDIIVERNTNSVAGNSIDTRAWFSEIDLQMLNGCKTLGFLMNRNSGSTESWGTVQMKLITDMVKSYQNKTKRLIENVGAIWLQLNGIQGNFKLTHNPLEYQSEMQKWEAQLVKDEHYTNAENQGWISTDEAAQGATGNPKATGTKNNTTTQNSNNENSNSSNSSSSNNSNKNKNE